MARLQRKRQLVWHPLRNDDDSARRNGRGLTAVDDGRQMVSADIRVQGIPGILGLQAAPLGTGPVVLGNADGELGPGRLAAAVAVVQRDVPPAALPDLVEVALEVPAAADVVDQVARARLVELVLGA